MSAWACGSYCHSERREESQEKIRMLASYKQSIILASTNPGKLREFSEILVELPVQLIPQSDCQITDVEETGLTFVENAILKARHASAASQLPAIADDSGLVVDALDGAPGVYSSRYAGEGASDIDRNNKLLAALAEVPQPQRSARFVSCIVLLHYPADPMPLIFQGRWEGSIGYAPKGTQGFGYDPLFVVPEKHCMAAELTTEEKNRISHRGQALQQLKRYLASK